MLHEFITLNHDAIIWRCRAKVARRSIPAPSEAEINHGVPLFLDQLVDALRSGETSHLEIDRSAGQPRTRPSAQGVHRVAGCSRLW